MTRACSTANRLKTWLPHSPSPSAWRFDRGIHDPDQPTAPGRTPDTPGHAAPEDGLAHARPGAAPGPGALRRGFRVPDAADRASEVRHRPGGAGVGEAQAADPDDPGSHREAR